VYTTSANAASIPDVTVIYREKDSKDHTTVVKIINGFDYSMVVPLGTHINLRASTFLPAQDAISSLFGEVRVNDNIINSRMSNGSNGIAQTDGTYELITDFQGEARGVAQ
jgi:hypothetical protein